MNNQSVRGANYSFKLFLYGFLFLIAMVTICNIINSVAMSVEARMKQYGGLRAIGLSDRQLTKMIVTFSVLLAIREPVRKIHEMSIVDTINAQ